uniref:CCHC-type domain-containing protein n=1 Tax=Ananas comosus var. bracteatus TaxID=296719 RepID=A0A6V7NSF5_ANACO|nr:unnamed protein product [Ananas comosus var. bracteatus]
MAETMHEGRKEGSAEVGEHSKGRKEAPLRSPTSVEVDEHSRGRKEAPLRSSASRRLVVGESSKRGKRVGGQAPLRSSAPRCLEVGESSKGGKGVGCQATLRNPVTSNGREEAGVKKKSGKRITWADEVGEELLKHSRSFEEEEEALATFGKNFLSKQKEGFNAGHQWSKLRAPPLEARSGNNCRGEDGANKCPIPSSSLLSRESYKDVLMKRPEPHYPARYPQRSNLHTAYPSYPSRGTPRRSLAKRCYRCLASDHVASACRDPVRCWRCWKTGHQAYSCRGKSTTSDASMDRVVNRRGRAPLPKVFVPYTEEYLRRVELRRNAVLADIIQPANLGQDPITVINTALASRFGGYVDDFAVSRYRDRDFAIFLPEWVPADLLIRREIITLNGFWLRCWPWGQYRYARPHRVMFKAWIRLLNLPFEIWSVARVAALVSSFGRFIRAD